MPFENIYPPVSGGMHTCFHLIHSLANQYNVFVVTYQDETILAAGLAQYDSSQNIQIYSIKNSLVKKSFVKKKYQSLLYRIKKMEFYKSADANFINYNTIVDQLLRTFHIDYFIVQMLSDVQHFSYFKKISQHTRFIYQSHNVDTELALNDYHKGKISFKKYRRIQLQESSLNKHTDAVLTVSSSDDDKLQCLNAKKLKSFVIQTGFVMPKEPATFQVNQNTRNTVVFFGSLNYSPNIQALHWFIDNCWNSIRAVVSDAQFLIIGSGNCDNVSSFQQVDGVKIHGFVEDTWDFYNQSAVSIVPVQEGSGIRIKILESMAMGVPVVSTSIGAEGILCTNGIDILIEDDPHLFSNRIIEVLSNKELRVSLSSNGRSLINKSYQWSHIVNNIEKSLEALSA